MIYIFTIFKNMGIIPSTNAQYFVFLTGQKTVKTHPSALPPYEVGIKYPDTVGAVISRVGLRYSSSLPELYSE